MIFQVPATISKITTLHDRTIRLQVDTQEINDPKQEAMILGLRNRLGYFAYKISEITDKEVSAIPETVKINNGRKTASQRLRGAIYIYCKQNGMSDEAAEDFYQNKIEDYIQFWREQIDADIPSPIEEEGGI
jgi:hypothetical protein